VPAINSSSGGLIGGWTDWAADQIAVA